MKRRTPKRRGSRAYSREFNSFLFERIEKALRFGDVAEIQNTINLGKQFNEDHRKATAAALSRKRQLDKITPMLHIIGELSAGGKKPVTVAAVLDACAEAGISYAARTARDELDFLGLREPDKPGPKRKK